MNFKISKDEKGVSHLLRGPRHGLCNQLIPENRDPSITKLVTCEDCNELIQKVKEYLIK